MTGPSGRDLYKTYLDLQGLGKKNQINKQQKLQFRCLTCSGETPSLVFKIVFLVGALPVKPGRDLGVAGLLM